MKIFEKLRKYCEKMIYLDNAATTLYKPDTVAKAVIEAIGSAGNASRGAHENSLMASRVVYNTRVKLAQLFHCKKPENVAFTANATESLNIAINGIFQKGDHVITTAVEHNSVLRPLYRLEDAGIISLDIVPADDWGRVSYEAFEDLLRPETRAIVCTHASNLTGNVLDIERIGTLAHDNGILLVVDASQSAGVIPIDMEKMNIDILCFTGHKGLYGPQGTGGICVSDGITIRPWKVGGTGVSSYRKTQPEEMPTCLEAGTLNSHGIAGLGAALDFIIETGVEVIHERELFLAKHFYDGIRDVEGVKVYGDFSSDNRTAIVSINLYDWDSAITSDELAENYGIATRPGAHCAPLMHKSLGTVDQGAVRFSFSWFNTEEEVDAAILAVKELVG